MIYLDNHAALVGHTRILLTAHEVRIIELETALQALLIASQEARATSNALFGAELYDLSDAEFDTLDAAATAAVDRLITAESKAHLLCTTPQTPPTR
jgi:hypothetical protein